MDKSIPKRVSCNPLQGRTSISRRKPALRWIGRAEGIVEPFIGVGDVVVRVQYVVNNLRKDDVRFLPNRESRLLEGQVRHAEERMHHLERIQAFFELLQRDVGAQVTDP